MHRTRDHRDSSQSVSRHCPQVERHLQQFTEYQIETQGFLLPFPEEGLRQKWAQSGACPRFSAVMLKAHFGLFIKSLAKGLRGRSTWQLESRFWSRVG